MLLNERQTQRNDKFINIYRRLTTVAIFCKKCKKMYNNNIKTKETEIKKESKYK
jgi:ABC-type dipeptide/oligopeptide/nickel transport system ATPase subunit